MDPGESSPRLARSTTCLLVVDGQSRGPGVLGVVQVDRAQVQRGQRAVGDTGEEDQHPVGIHQGVGLGHHGGDGDADHHVVGPPVVGDPHDEVVEGLVRGLGVEGDQLAVVALRQVGQTVLEALQAFVAHLRGDDLGGAVGLLDGPLDMHQPHRAAGAHEDGGAPRPEVAAVARLAVGGGDVGSLAAEVGGVVVVQAAHVGVHQAVEGGLADQVEGAPPGDVLGHGTHRGRRTGIEHDDVVEAGAVGQLVHQGLVVLGVDAVAHDLRGRGLLHEPLHRGGHVGHHDGGRGVQTGGELVVPLVAGPADDPHGPAGLGLQAATLGVGRHHATPRLQRGGLGVPHRVGDGQQAGAVVGVEHLRAHQVVLDQPAGDGVAVGRALPVLVDVGLHGQPLTGVVAVLEVLADLDDREADLVPQPGGLLAQVAVVELRVAAARAEDLHVGEAETHAVDAHQHLVGIGLGDGHQLGLVILAHVLVARAVDVPGPALARQVEVGRAVPVVRRCHGSSVSRAFMVILVVIGGGGHTSIPVFG